MVQVLRVWGGSYHDYWFAEDAILKVRLVPRIITVVGIVTLVALTLLFSVLGVLVGAAFAVVIYLASGRLGRRRRDDISLLSVEQVRQKGLVTLRIPYSVISGAELRGHKLTISVEGRRIRINVPEQDLKNLQSLLRSKLSDSLLVLDN